jgi:hypothetical protein
VKKMIVIFCLLLAGQVRADEWTKADTVRQAISSAFIIVDWGQTLDLENHPRLHEGNRILGAHPSRGEINTYFASCLIINYAVARSLPSSWRPYFQYFIIGIEAHTDYRNWTMGAGFNF